MTLEKEFLSARYGDPGLVRYNQMMFNDWVRGSRDLRREMIHSQTLLMDGVDSMVVESQTRLTKSQYSAMSSSTREQVRHLVSNSNEVIRQRIDASMRRSIRAYNDYFKSHGISPLSSEEQDKILSSMRRNSQKDFPPGSGLNYDKRIKRVGRFTNQQINKTLKSTYEQGNVSEGINSRLRSTLQQTGRTRAPGGSMINKMNKIMVAEESRAAREVAIEALKFKDIAFAYWRLHPSHPWYGGGEVCEVRASSTQGEVITALREAGINPGAVDLEGLFLVASWPEHPHPWCKCYPEPFQK